MPIPENNHYLYGYIAYSGSFLLSNIFHFVGNSPSIPEEIEESPLLHRDLLHGSLPFRKLMQRKDRLCYWFLSKQVVKNPLPPQYKYVLHGGRNEEQRIYNFIQKEYEPGFASEADKNLYQTDTEYYPSYYPKFLYAKMVGKKLKYDTATKTYIIIE